jgi:hypothetical protein
MIVCPVREFRVQENWSVLVWKILKPEVSKPKESKWWGMMMSPGGDVDPRRLSSTEIQSLGDLRSASVKSSEAQNFEVTWLADVTRDDVDTWDVCHMSMSFEHVED